MSISYLFVSVHPAQTADPREVTESTNGISEASSISALPGTLPGTLTLTPIYALPGFDLWRFSYTEPDWATNLTGIIHKPEGDGPYPAVVISHGKGGTAEGFSLVKAQTWFSDYISIAPNYTHAANEIGGTGPQGGSPENVKRAIRCLDILESQNLVDLIGEAVDRDKLYLYGNSMGGFVTIETAAQAGERLKGAAYTASGLSQTDANLTPSGAAAAATVQAPFLLLHGKKDGTVTPAASQAWAEALTTYDKAYQLVWFPEIGHDLNSNELTAPQAAQFIRDWFSLPSPLMTGLSPASGSPGDNLTISGSYFGSNLNNNSQILFNGQAAIPNLWSETTVETRIPDQAASGAVRLIVPVGPITDAQVLQPVTGGQRSNELYFSVISNGTPTNTSEPGPTKTDTPVPTDTSPTKTSTPAYTPTGTASATPETPAPPTATPTMTSTPTVTATNNFMTLFADNFDRSDSSAVGNGWVEVETTGAQVGIQSNRLCFLDTSDVAIRPIASHSFQPFSAGELVWEFDFDWKRTGTEKAYRHFMQLGQSALMSDSSQSAGVGINLTWTALNSVHETLAYRLGGVDTSLATLSGPAAILVTTDLNAHTYQVSVNGAVVGSGIPFDNDVSLDTVRYFTDGLNEIYFSGRCFDNLTITAGNAATASPTLSPTTTPSETGTPTANPTPTELPTLTPTVTHTSIPSPTPTPTPTSTPTPIASPTPTLSATPTASSTPTPTATDTMTPTSSQTASATATATLTSTPSGDPLDYVARWRFDEGTDTLAYDDSANGNTLTLTNGATWGNGHNSTALSLDGTNDYATRSDASLAGSFPAKSINTTQHFTLSSWIRLDRTGINQPILTKQGSRKANGFNMYVDSQDKLSLEVFSGINTFTVARSTTSLAANNWYHVAVTYEYLSSYGSVIKIYINGLLDSTLTNAVGPVRTNTQALTVGWYGGNIWFLDGLIDDLRVYARVLSEQEIAALAR